MFCHFIRQHGYHAYVILDICKHIIHAEIMMANVVKYIAIEYINTTGLAQILYPSLNRPYVLRITEFHQTLHLQQIS